MKFMKPNLFLFLSIVVKLTLFEFGSGLPVDSTAADPKAAAISPPASASPETTAAKTESLDGRALNTANVQNNATKPDGAALTTVKNENLESRAQNTANVQNNATKPDGAASTTVKDEALETKALPTSSQEATTNVQNSQTAAAKVEATLNSSLPSAALPTGVNLQNNMKIETNSASSLAERALGEANSAIKNQLTSNTVNMTNTVQQNPTVTNATNALTSSAPLPETSTPKSGTNEPIDTRALSNSGTQNSAPAVSNTLKITSVQSGENVASNNVPAIVLQQPSPNNNNNPVILTSEEFHYFTNTGSLQNGELSRISNANLDYSLVPSEQNHQSPLPQQHSPLSGSQVIDALKIANSMVSEVNNENLNALGKSIEGVENIFSNQQLQLPFN